MPIQSTDYYDWRRNPEKQKMAENLLKAVTLSFQYDHIPLEGINIHKMALTEAILLKQCVHLNANLL